MTDPVWQYHHPTKLVFGVDALVGLGEEAARLGKRALLVSYRDHRGLEEILEGVGEELRRAGIQLASFLEIEPDPDESTGRRGAELARDRGVELVVGVGGGSAMDAAKGIAGLTVSGRTPWDYTRCNPARVPFAGALPVVAIPTTAGTGSEMTNTVVFSHPERDLKAAIVEPSLFPTLALVDPRLMVGAPPALTAHCGVDALGQCVEAYLSKTTNALCRAVAVDGFRRILAHLPSAIRDGGNLEARQQVALGTTLSGVAISHGGTCATHAMSHALGALLHVRHGLGVGVCTVPVLRYCQQTEAELLAQFSRAVGLCAPGCPDVEAAEELVSRLSAFLREAGIPATLVSAGSPDLPGRLTENAFHSTPAAVANTPREMTREAMAEMFARLLS